HALSLAQSQSPERIVIPTSDETNVGRRSKIIVFLLREMHELLPPTIFFFLTFNLMLFTKKLILEEYRVEFDSFIIATVSALIVGKVVLVIEPMSFLRRLDHRPLVYPILFKALVYTVLFSVVRLIEPFIHYLVAGGVIGRGGFIEEVLGKFSWAHFMYVQLWVLLLFVTFFTMRELNSLFSEGELVKIFFLRGAPGLKADAIRAPSADNPTGRDAIRDGAA